MEANQLSTKDLRIGNYVYFKNTTDIGTVELIHNKHFDCRDEYGSFIPNGNYEQIPLSEDVLLKLGFEKYSAENFKHQKVDKLRAYLQPIRNGYGIYLEGCYSLPNIKSVHQLQNLYHALTGEELDDEENDDEFIEREFTITEYSIGDWGDLGKKIGTIKAIDKYSAKNKFQKLKNISDYEIAFYSFD